MEKERKQSTDEGEDNEEDVETEAGAGGDEELGDGADGDNDGGDGHGEQHLDGQDRVDLPDECPSQLWRLHHRRIQRPHAAGLHISSLVRWPEPHFVLRIGRRSSSSSSSLAGDGGN